MLLKAWPYWMRSTAQKIIYNYSKAAALYYRVLTQLHSCLNPACLHEEENYQCLSLKAQATCPKYSEKMKAFHLWCTTGGCDAPLEAHFLPQNWRLSSVTDCRIIHWGKIPLFIKQSQPNNPTVMWDQYISWILNCIMWDYTLAKTVKFRMGYTEFTAFPFRSLPIKLKRRLNLWSNLTKILPVSWV